MADIRSINSIRARRENDNKLLSPKDCLLDAIAEIDEGSISPTRTLVICLDDSDGRYEISWLAANANCSGMISMLEVTKAIILREMGYIPNG